MFAPRYFALRYWTAFYFPVGAADLRAAARRVNRRLIRNVGTMMNRS